MITIVRKYQFSAAHQLTGLREGHKCARLHGHNYTIELTLTTKQGVLLNGFVVDAEDLDVYVMPIIKRLDHTLLNESLNDGTTAGAIAAAQPTVEHLVEYLWQRLQFLTNGLPCRLACVRASENDRLWAERTAEAA